MMKKLFPTLVLLSSCATTPPREVTYSKSVTPTPSKQIKNYREQSQQTELANIIDNPDQEKPKFLRDVKNEKVDFWINYFAKKDKERFQRFIANGMKYKDIIETTLEDYGLPKELFYVGLIESGYYLGAKSHAGAVGPWQFIRSTGRRYGLKITPQVDERRSIHKATIAAAHFFQDLYNIFGSWELALSAYNAGEYGVIRRIRKSNTRDFYELSARKLLPKETRNYVPKVLAALTILNNPGKYGITIPNHIKNPYAGTQTIQIVNSIHLSQIARAKRIRLEDLRELNPDLLGNYVPHIYRRGYELRVPNGNYQFVKNLKSSPRTRTRRTFEGHIIRRGENLSYIAKNYNVNLNSLMKANGLSRSSTIYVGQKLKIPSSTGPEYSQYKIQKGDNLYSLARSNNTSVSEIMKINGLKSKRIFVGQALRLPATSKIYHTVRKGEYLGVIARRYGTSIGKIKKINQLSRNRIYTGQKLLVKID